MRGVALVFEIPLAICFKCCTINSYNFSLHRQFSLDLAFRCDYRLYKLSRPLSPSRIKVRINLASVTFTVLFFPFSVLIVIGNGIFCRSSTSAEKNRITSSPVTSFGFSATLLRLRSLPVHAVQGRKVSSLQKNLGQE